jgi:hypothetical protein
MPGSFDSSMLVDDEEFTTEPDEFGLFRTYPHRPKHDPDRIVPLETVCNAPGLVSESASPSTLWITGITRSLLDLLPENPVEPLQSVSVFRLLDWAHRTTQVSVASLNSLVRDVICAPDFDCSDPALTDFSAAREYAKLDRVGCFAAEDGWKTGSVDIPVPFTGLNESERTDEHTYSVHGAYWRSLTEVMKDFFSHVSMDMLHLTPFKIFWMSPDGTQPVHSEIYNSQAMYDEYTSIRNDFQNKTSLEIIVAAMMFWSDSTHLASFGTASLWPVYMYFGNISKYLRGKPSSFMANHIAYLPKVRASYLL